MALGLCMPCFSVAVHSGICPGQLVLVLFPQQQPKNGQSGLYQEVAPPKTSKIQSKVLYPGFHSRAAAVFLGTEIRSLLVS